MRIVERRDSTERLLSALRGDVFPSTLARPGRKRHPDVAPKAGQNPHQALRRKAGEAPLRDVRPLGLVDAMSVAVLRWVSPRSRITSSMSEASCAFASRPSWFGRPRSAMTFPSLVLQAVSMRV